MDTAKYSRSITLLCPTCGSTHFSPSSTDNVESELQKCESCDREITRDELIRENGENIDAHVDDIKKQVTQDLAKELKKKFSSAFKGSNFIKVK